MIDDDDQLKIARRMVVMLAERLGLEMDLFRRSLGRTPTKAEMAGRIRDLFWSDPWFHDAVMAAKAQAEAEEMRAWREQMEATHE